MKSLEVAIIVQRKLVAEVVVVVVALERFQLRRFRHPRWVLAPVPLHPRPIHHRRCQGVRGNSLAWFYRASISSLFLGVPFVMCLLEMLYTIHPFGLLLRVDKAAKCLLKFLATRPMGHTT